MNMLSIEFFGAEEHHNPGIAYGEFDKNERHAVGCLTDMIVGVPYQPCCGIEPVVLTMDIETKRIRICYWSTNRVSQAH
jgi:hypothetical protein